MPIKKPDRVLLHHIPLKFVRNKVGGGGGKATNSEIPLIPFIDFLMTLVVFLLTTFGANELSTPATITMPDAHNAAVLGELAPIIVIDQRVVTLDGRRMADTQTLAATAAVERIEQLIQDLEQTRRNWSIIHPREPFPGTVIIQADREIDFRVVKKVMFSVAQAGYVNISFAVNRRAGT